MVLTFCPISLSTSGFFRCNRWVDQKEHTSYDDKSSPDENAIQAATNLTNEDLSDPTTMQATYGTAMHESRVASRRSREVGRFLHHYRRWSAHAESAELESRMRDSTCERLAPVVQAAIEFSGEGERFNFDGRGLSFVHAAFTELLECRSVLQHSYGFSFLRYKSMSAFRWRMSRGRYAEKVTFERQQAELEMMTEQISDVVARSHLRATQTQIVFLTTAAAEKRKEFSNLMVTILVEERKSEVKKTEGKKSKKNKSTRTSHLPPGLLESISPSRTPPEERTASEPPTAEMEVAIRASLEEFMTNSGALQDLNVEDSTGDWPCRACTFVNSNCRRCAMCGTYR